jgi:DnaJ-class molecular chaperone
VQKFLELTHARDVLLDPKKKEAYDKKLSHELLAKKKQREREAELDGRRRQMRDGSRLLNCHLGGGSASF